MTKINVPLSVVTDVATSPKDIDSTGVTNGQVLVYSSAGTKFVAGTVSGGGAGSSNVVTCAAPTGVAATDNSNFQTALTNGSGGTVQLQAGTYNLTSAPTITSSTRVVGDKSTVLQCNASGAFFDLTNLNHIRFEGVTITTSTTSTTLFKCSGTFNCSWSNVLVLGTHSLGSPQPAQIGWAFTNNAGDNYIEGGSEIEALGVGFSVGSFANYLSDSKVANCQYGCLSAVTFSAGMIINNCSLASTPGGTTISQISIPDNSGKWLISNTDMEGATTTVSVGSGVLNHGPTLFSMVNCNLEGSTTILNIQSAYGCYLAGIVFTADPSTTPTSLAINATGAPNGTAMGLTTNVAADSAVIAASLFPTGWNFLGKSSSVLQGISVAKSNFTATTDPLVTSDSASGYGVGSQWVNTTTSMCFQCLSASVGAAVWVLTRKKVTVFTATGTYTKQPWSTTVDVWGVAPGGAGGSGVQAAVNTVRVGGGGGGGGGTTWRSFSASDLTSTVSVTVAAAGAGGAAQATADTAGNAGSASGSTHSFGAYLRCFSGGVGAAGGLAGTGGTGGAGGTGMIPGVAGAAASTAGAAGTFTTGSGGYGGGSGGGISSGNTANAGGQGSAETSAGGLAGTAGTAGGGAGGTGGNGPLNSPTWGGGGGGGGASITGAAGAAGAGGSYGAGGGGGGASLDGNASGAGGNAGPGVWVVIEG